MAFEHDLEVVIAVAIRVAEHDRMPRRGLGTVELVHKVAGPAQLAVAFRDALALEAEGPATCPRSASSTNG